jgi:hypothetical protein
MNSVEIIQKSMQGKLPPGVSEGQFLNGINFMLKKQGYKLIQIGNSAFLAKPDQAGTVEVHTFSAEKPAQLVQNYVELAKMLKQQGFKKAVSYSSDPGYTKIAKMSGLPVKVTQTVRKEGKEMKPTYQFELEL